MEPEFVAEGVDDARGLSNAGGDTALYRRLLRRFAVDQADAASRAREAAEQGDGSTARRLLHTLRGTAGTIGADQLADLAGTAESALAGDPGGAARIDWDGLAHRLEGLVEGLGALAPEPTTGAPVESGAAESEALLADLLVQLEDYDTGAADTIDRLLAGAPTGAFREALRHARKAIQQYDFAAAYKAMSGTEPI